MISTPQVFIYSKGWKTGMFIICTAFLCGAGYFFYQAFAVGHNISINIGIGTIIVLISVLMAVNMMRRRITVTDHDITIRGTFTERTMEFKNAKGYRMEKNVMFIDSTSADVSTLTIGDFSYMDTDGQLTHLIRSKLHNITHQKRNDSYKKLMEDDDFGSTRQERRENLKSAKTLSSWLNNIGIGVSLWVLLYPHPYNAAIITALAYPVVVLYVFYKKKSVISIGDDDNNTTAYPSIQRALYSSAFVLLLRALLDYELIHFKACLPVYGCAVLILLLPFVFIIGINELNTKKTNNWLYAAGFVLLFAYGAVICLNCAFDRQPSKKQQARVTDMHYSSGKHTSYYLTLTPWGDRTSNEDVAISRALYKSTKVGDTVTVYQKPGLLHIPWYFVDK